MGDRANVYIHDGNKTGVFLYTHWMGTELPATLQTALKREERWDDALYLARIIFCEMVKGGKGNETGYGISTMLCDNEHLILCVDTDKETVSFVQESEITKPRCERVPVKTFSFKEYIKETAQGLAKAYGCD